MNTIFKDVFLCPDFKYDYMEIILVNPSSTDSLSRTYDMSSAAFYSLYNNFKTPSTKFFYVDLKEHVKGNLHLIKKIEKNMVTDTKLYTMKPIRVIDTSCFRIVFFERRKLSTMAFPSTLNHDVVYVKRKLVSRINNKLYLNFQQEMCVGSDDLHYKIYINFNNNKDTDINDTFQILTKLMSEMTNKEPTS